MFFARSYDSEHLPQERLLIETLKRSFPDAAQVACFDSHFHDEMPTVASMTTLPRRFHTAGIRRSGFHGISCAYIMRELAGLADSDAARGKLVIAHLGGGCSVTAVSAGRSIDTSMGVTPAGGMLMATRSGDVDPGLAWRLFREHDISVSQFNHITNHESGLKGISGTTGDLQQLMAISATDHAAAEAVAMFCYQAKKQIGAMACALEGLDTLVFAGGIGENSSMARQGICEGLAFLGVEIDSELNLKNAPVISTTESQVIVRIVATNEQIIIAEETMRFLGKRERSPQGVT
jgi:acetate kinase